MNFKQIKDSHSYTATLTNTGPPHSQPGAYTRLSHHIEVTAQITHSTGHLHKVNEAKGHLWQSAFSHIEE